MPRLSIAVFILAAVGVSPLAALAHSGNAAVTVTRAPRQLGGPFTLTDQNGHRVSDADFTGKLRLMYFGYTNCGDACPLDLQNIAAALDLLGERGRDVVAVFVTIDPARDTPARLEEFLPLFHRDIVGLTGDADAIHTLAAAYGVDYDKIAVKSADVYDLTHPAIAFVMGRHGEFLDLVRPADGPAAIAKALRRRLDDRPPLLGSR